MAKKNKGNQTGKNRRPDLQNRTAKFVQATAHIEQLAVRNASADGFKQSARAYVEEAISIARNSGKIESSIMNSVNLFLRTGRGFNIIRGAINNARKTRMPYEELLTKKLRATRITQPNLVNAAIEVDRKLRASMEHQNPVPGDIFGFVNDATRQHDITELTHAEKITRFFVKRDNTGELKFTAEYAALVTGIPKPLVAEPRAKPVQQRRSGKRQR